MTKEIITEIAIVAIAVPAVIWIVRERLLQEKVASVQKRFEYIDYEDITAHLEVTLEKDELTYRSPQGDLPIRLGEVKVSKGDLDKQAGEVKVSEGDLHQPIGELSVKYTSPRTELLSKIPQLRTNEREVEQAKRAIMDKLAEYGIEIKAVTSVVGPSITLYKVLPSAGVKVSQITNLSDDLALALSCSAVMVYPIQGDNKIGLEVPNKSPQMVSAREVFESQVFTKSNYELPICLGKAIDGSIKVIDLAEAPHLLIAGATGKGKSVGINMLIASLLFKKHPEALKFVMIDPKRVELSTFEGINRQFLLNVTGEQEAIITDVSLAQVALEKLCELMDERYELLKANRVRNIAEYNAKGKEKLFYIVVVIDELADLMMTAGKGIEIPLCRLAQLARAIGIHLIVATQRPSSKILTGDIKTNFPTRWSFQVSSGVDSKIILDTVGAENLVGRGDSLFSKSGGKLERIQCAFIDTKEVNKMVDYVAKQPAPKQTFHEYSQGHHNEKIEPQHRDSLADQAVQICRSHGRCNISLLKRKLNIGDTRAARIIEQIQHEWDT